MSRADSGIFLYDGGGTSWRRMSSVVPWQNRTTGTTSVIPFPSFPTLVPALQPKVELGLTWSYISLYAILFFMVYIQLWMIWYYRHKRFSYQTVFLFLSLLWSGLRITLFAFFFRDTAKVNIFPFVPYWLLFCFPVCLQFIILCLLVLFFAQVVFKARAKYQPNKFKLPMKIALAIVVMVFLGTNIGCAAVAKIHQSKSLPVFMLYLRVTGTSMCQAISACVLVTLLYVSRAVYNLVAVCPVSRHGHKLPSFGYGWINVTDQADFVNLTQGYAYLSFAIVLFVWEILPMFIVIILFRVRKPNSSKDAQNLPPIDDDSRSYFFDNPRRYDSDDEIEGQDTPSINFIRPDENAYSINGVLDSPRGTPSRPHRLGYGAVISTDHNYSGSPVMPSPSQKTLLDS